MNQSPHSQLQIRPSLQFSAKAAIQTASMMFSILRRKVASASSSSSISSTEIPEKLLTKLPAKVTIEWRYGVSVTEMEGSRRRLLIDAAATAAALLTLGTSRSHPGISPRLAVSYEDPGQAIASDFIGLSYESAI
jgi:hypothetical protein